MPPYSFPTLRQTAPRHITWKRLKTYTTVYKRGRTRITVKSVTKPPQSRLFRTTRGNKQFKAVSIKSTTREVIIVAKTKNRKKPVETDEIEELEAIEELEELEDEEELEDVDEVEEDDEEEDDEPEDEDDDDDEDEDEPPVKSRSKGKKTTTKASTKTKAKKPAQSRAAANGKVGTNEVASHLGIDGRSLRMMLRKHNIAKDPDSGRYEWSSLNHKTVVKLQKLVAAGEDKKAKREGLDKLKAKKAAEAKSSTKSKSTKKRRVVEEDEDDE